MKSIKNLLIVVVLALVLTGCTDTLTGGKTIDMGKLQVYIEQFGKEAVVEEYSWDGTKEGLTLVSKLVTNCNRLKMANSANQYRIKDSLT